MPPKKVINKTLQRRKVQNKRKAGTSQMVALTTEQNELEEELNCTGTEDEADRSSSLSQFSNSDFENEGEINKRRRKRKKNNKYDNQYGGGNYSNIHKTDIPSFCIDEPFRWITDVQAVFNVFGEKNQRRKIELVAGIIPTELIKKIKTPLTENCFDELVEIIEKKYSYEARKQLREIFSKGMKNYELATEYLERVRKAIGASTYDILNQNNPIWLKEIFVGSLPIKIRPIIYSKMTTRSLEELAEVAEDMLKCMNEEEENIDEGNHRYRRLYHVQKEPQRMLPTRDTSRENRQRKDIEEMNRTMKNMQEDLKTFHKTLSEIQLDLKRKELDIEALKNKPNMRSYRPNFEARGRSQYRDRSLKRKAEDDLCRFHTQFGHRSFKCERNGCAMELLVEAMLQKKGHLRNQSPESKN